MLEEVRSAANEGKPDKITEINMARSGKLSIVKTGSPNWRGAHADFLPAD